MAKMSLGNFVFPTNPSKMTMIDAKRFTDEVETLTGVAFYSWGTMVDGLPVKLEWKFMRSSTYATLQTLLMADTPATFNPQDGLGRIYEVEIKDLDGQYHRGLGIAANTHRTDIKLILVILGRV